MMCVAGYGVGAGDEVITTALSWTTSATCILHHMAIPIFVDVDWDSMHLNPARIEAAITARTKAIRWSTTGARPAIWTRSRPSPTGTAWR
jgi:dTDP-4-amino-4,6-dideoxygalactose transaminase